MCVCNNDDAVNVLRTHVTTVGKGHGVDRVVRSEGNFRAVAKTEMSREAVREARFLKREIGYH